MKLLIIAGVLFFLTPAKAEWVLNNLGASNKYQLHTFDDDGRVNNLTPLPSGVDVVHTGWPSGLIVSGQKVVYANELVSVWGRIARWAHLGGSWTRTGVVFSADPVAEPNGFGTIWVGYNSATSMFLMYYSLLGPAGQLGASINLATSSDGLNWTRQGSVLTVSAPYIGATVAHACRASNGDIVLSYSAHTASQGLAFIARGVSAGGPFTSSVAMSPDSWSSTLFGVAGLAIGLLPDGVTAPIGIPLRMNDSTEVMVVQKQVGTVLYLEWPLRSSYNYDAISSMARNKVDFSYIAENSDGSWSGIATLYGSNPLGHGFDEYTTRVQASSLTSRWSFARDGITFDPFFLEGAQSTENPHKFVADMSCAN